MLGPWPGGSRSPGRRARARALARAHRELPLAAVLGVLVALAVLAGAARAPAAPARAIPRRLVAIAAASGLASVALVIALAGAFV